MAADLTLTTTSTNSNVGRIAALGSVTPKTVAFAGLNYVDLTTDVKLYYVYGDTNDAFSATAKSMVLAGMCRSIPRDPSVKPTDTWYITVLSTATSEVDFVAYNKGGS